MISVIYKITNPVGKIYIGQTTNLPRRISQYKRHYCKDQHLLFNSLNKYGFQKHTVSVLCSCLLDDINDLERYFICEYKSNDRSFGLNLTSGGQDYFTHSTETKKRMSAAQMGNKKALGFKQSEETITKRVSKLSGKKRTELQRQRMSLSHIGIKYRLRKKRNTILNPHYKNKQIVDLITRRVFNNCVEPALFYGYKKSTLVAMLNGQNPNKTTLRYFNNSK